MNFKKINRLIFTKENPNNDYATWDTGNPPFSPAYNFYDISENDYHCIIQAKTRIDEAICSAVLDYVNNKDLCNDQDEMFPRSDRMTGNFYISEENYLSFDDGIMGRIMTHFTEMYNCKVTKTLAEQDYLGLEVHFELYYNGDFEINGIDSSSI